MVGGTPNRITKGGDGTRFTSSRRSTEEGLGDLLLQGRYYVLEEGEMAPLMAVTGLVKFPTADEDKGLGTGELDLGFGLEFSKTFARNWLGLFDVGYTFIGDPSGIDLRDQWYYVLDWDITLPKIFSSAGTMRNGDPWSRTNPIPGTCSSP